MRTLGVLIATVALLPSPSACTSQRLNSESDDCASVELEALYADPAPFYGTRVCSSGRLLVLKPTLIALIPHEVSLDGPWKKLLYVEGEPEATRRILRNENFKSGTLVQFSGEFTYDKDCWHDAPDESGELICAPVQYPMFLTDVLIKEAR